MSKIITIKGKPYITVIRDGKPHLRSYAVTVAPTADPFADIRADLIASLGEEGANEMIAKMMAKGIKVKAPAGKSIRAQRAAADGGICPFVGLDFENRDGVHHIAGCGKEHDGHFAKRGNVTSAGNPGRGYLGHIEWAAEVDQATIDTALAEAIKAGRVAKGTTIKGTTRTTPAA